MVYFYDILWQIYCMENLKEIRNELLSLHKTLMDIEKENYEAQFGKVSPNQLLQLLFDNENFTWLRTISILVVEIDEMLADKKGVDEAFAKSLLKKTESLFDESEEFSDFKTKYKVNLDTESSVGKHHQRLLDLLEKEKA